MEEEEEEEEKEEEEKEEEEKKKKVWVCGRSHAEIVGSNPAGGMDVCLL
jgi:hypothetical protein